MDERGAAEVEEWARYRQAVGLRVRRERLRANLTQEILADRSGVGRNTLQRIEKGDPEAPRLGALWRLARTLQVSLVTLLREVTDDESSAG